MKSLILTGGKFEYEFVVSYYKTHSYDCVIAVDNGEQYAKMAGIAPNLLVGDFDTRGDEGLDAYEKSGVRIIRSIPEKDDTDTEMAIQECIRMGSDFDLLCATGGRLDHLLGNIHNLKLGLDAGLQARMIDSRNIVELVAASRPVLRKDYPHKYISFLPFAGPVEKVTLQGFKYEIEDCTLEPGYSLGVSNEFATEEAYVKLGAGGILVMINAKDR